MNGCFQFCSVLVATLLLTGCGSSTAQVAGQVTFEGRPLSNGSVMAFGTDGVPRYGQIDTKGRYTIDRIPAGRIVCAVSSPDPKAETVQRPRGSAPSLPSPDTSTPAPGKWFPIPDRYGTTSLSKLEYQLSAGPNQFDLKLTK